jgi:peptidoglycan hydrolase CwlO-like protein
MDSSTVIWVIVAIVVVLIVIAAAVALSKRASVRKDEKHRERANELREQAAATQQGIRRHQAEADATEARAREMRAEADRRQAEAKRLEADLHDKRSTLNEHVQRRDEVLAEADAVDPDVDTDGSADDSNDVSDADTRGAQHRA